MNVQRWPCQQCENAEQGVVLLFSARPSYLTVLLNTTATSVGLSILKLSGTRSSLARILGLLLSQ